MTILAESSPTFQDIQNFLKKQNGRFDGDKKGLQEVLQAFVDANENPSRSPNFKSRTPDRLECIIQVLKDPGVKGDLALVLLLLKTLKVLSRKQDNRLKTDDETVLTVLHHLQPPPNLRIAAEGANVILNLCYEKVNVDRILRNNGVPTLITFLTDADPELQANASGAIQSICFQERGRKRVRELGAVGAVIELLESSVVKVQTRAVGALHNLSSDSESIRLIRRQNGIPKLVQLLCSAHLPIAGSAAGAIQNMAREVASRMLLRGMDAICPLARLLSAPDVQVQVCAAGALLNILGPELDSGPEEEDAAAGAARRRAFGQVMTLILATSAIYDSVFSCRPALGL